VTSQKGKEDIYIGNEGVLYHRVGFTSIRDLQDLYRLIPKNHTNEGEKNNLSKISQSLDTYRRFP